MAFPMKASIYKSSPGIATKVDSQKHVFVVKRSIRCINQHYVVRSKRGGFDVNIRDGAIEGSF